MYSKPVTRMDEFTFSYFVTSLVQVAYYRI